MNNTERLARYNRRLDAAMQPAGDLYPRPLTPMDERTEQEHMQWLTTPNTPPPTLDERKRTYPMKNWLRNFVKQ